MEKYVYILRGIYHGKEIEPGVYPLNSENFPATLTESERLQGDGKLIIQINGKSRGVWVFRKDFYYTDETGSEGVAPAETVRQIESQEAMVARINKRFEVMELMSDGLTAGTIRSLIISGAAGIGKTHGLDSKLTRDHDDGKISYNLVTGKMTAIGLYEQLYKNRNSTCITAIDDVDVFSDMDTLNILKAALDTGEKRKICWNTASAYLEDNQIPKEFEYHGTVVFITNVDLDREIEKDTKLSPHIDALLSRSIYLDLGVHTNQEILIRIESVVRNTNMLSRAGLNQQEINDLLLWLRDNVDNLRTISLRTVLQIAMFINTSTTGWRDIAQTILFKPTR